MNSVVDWMSYSLSFRALFDALSISPFLSPLHSLIQKIFALDIASHV